MGYDWNGTRGRRMKIARFGIAIALAEALVTRFKATLPLSRLGDDGLFGA